MRIKTLHIGVASAFSSRGQCGAAPLPSRGGVRGGVCISLILKPLLLLVVLLMTGCSHSDEEGNGARDGECFLDVTVVAPDQPTLSRGDVGEIAPISDAESDAESKVKTLQIWVFKNRSGDLVAYYDATSPDLSTPYKQKKEIATTFADTPENVDVYAVANAASVGLTLNESTTRANLDAAVIGTDYFGTTTLTSSVPSDGLPMSAVLKNQPVYGSYPVLHVGTLKLTRAVSKLRFVLCQIETNNNPNKELRQIDDISLDADLIPTTSWLIPREAVNYTTTGAHSAISYGSVAPTDIPKAADPMVYAYETQAAQDYEDMINHTCGNTPADLDWLQTYGTSISSTYWAGLTTADLPQLTQRGLTYLRESDKQLTGTITYTYGTENTQKTVPFTMAAPGDFLRNHSWIVYIYYMDTKIHVLTVTHIGMKAWVSDGQPEDVKFYNW